ncbi:MAG: glycosyltransferase family 4 protein [Lentisphaerae bacterium]|nr:glycosyltransferase family 4 protein [Lentisphaerota bacterium]
MHLKILLCADDASANTVSWASGFRELGCEVVVVSVRARKSCDGTIALGHRMLPPRLRFLTSIGKLKKIIKAEKPDILIGYRITSYGFLSSCTGFTPLVLAAQNEQITYLPEPSYWREKILGFFARRAIRKANLIHAWSPNIKDGLKKFGAKDEQIFVMHRGIDLTVFFPGNRKYDRTRPVFISTRTLAREYRIEHLIEAFSLLLRDKPEAQLRIIGEGPEKENLLKFAGELGISGNVAFLGKLSPAEVAEKLRDSDIYVSTIQTEGISSSLLEACASGVFPIVGDIPSSRAIIRNMNSGMLIPELTPMQLADVMLKSSDDEAMLNSATEANLDTVRRDFDRHKNIGKFIELYSRLQQIKYAATTPHPASP